MTEDQRNTLTQWLIGVLTAAVLAWMGWISVQVWLTRVELAGLQATVASQAKRAAVESGE